MLSYLCNLYGVRQKEKKRGKLIHIMESSYPLPFHPFSLSRLSFIVEMLKRWTNSWLVNLLFHHSICLESFLVVFSCAMPAPAILLSASLAVSHSNNGLPRTRWSRKNKIKSNLKKNSVMIQNKNSWFR